jgi:hypothetical protein
MAEEQHPLTSPRITALFELIALFWAVGVVLMMWSHLPPLAFFIGLCVGVGCSLASLSLFWSDLLATIYHTKRHGELTKEAHIGFGIILFSIFLTAYIAYYSWPRPAPLTLFAATPQAAAYLPDTNVAGIKWKSSYSDLRLNISNPTSRDYLQLDATVRTDLIIMEVAQITGIANCKVIPYPNDPDAPHKFMLVDGSILISSPRRPRLEIPLLLGPGPFPSESYRLLCNRLPPQSSLQFVFAVATVASPHDPQTFEGFFIGLHNPSC